MRSLNVPPERAVFFDQNTLMESESARLVPGAEEALRRLHEAGFLIFVATNQPGVAQGRFGIQAIDQLESRLRSLLSDFAVPLGGFYFCPHDPAGSLPEFRRWCDCRKPRPGLLIRAAKEHQLDLKNSWMVAGTLDDVEAGNRAGCRSILLRAGDNAARKYEGPRVPHSVAKNIDDAAGTILLYREFALEAVHGF